MGIARAELVEMKMTHITSRVSRLVTADRAELRGTPYILHTHNLGMLEPELSPVSRDWILSYHALDSIDDNLIGTITDTVYVLYTSSGLRSG